MSIYDTLPSAGGDFVKWENAGDSVAGDLVEVRAGTNMAGDAVPEWVIRTDDGSDRVVTCSQAQLRSKAFELRPVVGDRIKVTFTRSEKRDGGKTLKHFTVDVVTGGAKGTAAAEDNGADEDPF